MDDNSIERMRRVVQGDFDDLGWGELNFLRNKCREAFKMPPDRKLHPGLLRRAFWMFKRKYSQTLDTVFIQFKTPPSASGVFAVDRQTKREPVEPLIDGLDGHLVRAVTVKPDFYPVIDVTYDGAVTVLTCMHDGYFFRVNDRAYDFQL